MKQLFLLISLFFSMALSGCDQLEYKGDPQYILYIQDAPANYNSLTIGLSSVELYNGSQWVLVTTDISQFNLLSLTGGAMLKVAWADMPSGRYTSLRVNFSPKNILLNSNRVNYSVTLSPENQSLIIPVDIELNKDEQFVSILDIDAAKSIIVLDENIFEFKPIARLFDISQMGVLNFMIVDTKNHPIAETILTKAFIEGQADTIYTYTNPSTGRGLMRLPAGLYDVIIEPSLSMNLYADTVKNIQINAGEPTNLSAVELVSSLAQ